MIIATKNDKKLHELRRYLKGVKATAHSLKDLGKTPRIVENGDTFKKNAIKKAVATSKFADGLALADDSGLAVDMLGGEPGVKSARFAGPHKSNHDNNVKLLRLLEGAPLKKRTARFICAVAIADKGKVVKVIEEVCKGLIAFSIRGRHGFGYDSVFLMPKYNKTFGELGLKAKDRMSHRSKALKKARAFLRKYLSGRSAAG
ncbi:MAG: RdgB/HAM1 family non-canonical purine NTP pyrophosphatase [Candidatus Omnitrophica bacterium]|nr:RdgB/HAM1 family non-canonical purine NTP pyrophosphatase [Candidatus Omnitrophota bacterium]